ncbi:hypothetical protein KUCAC02_001859 [Chaenocephalus aceratus]|uniref:Uncharacterized protein n=1 Tax=Chaenocephalus aceratus TaxID=36190 RepID=A0ACB9XTF7_CHAAC|nr:hypothetical protein KUCAC02_001859 [Chaenocephalus aceratus]
MAAKQQRSGKKEQSSVPAANGGDFNMTALANQLEQHRNAISADFKATISTLEAKLDCIQTTVSDHTHSINSLESNANEQDGRIQSLESMCAKLAENNTKLQAKLTDLESRSRRNNIRIIGLPESIEGPHPSSFFSELLAEVLGDSVFESPPECDRAHRTLSIKPGPGQRPRPVVIRLHRFQQKDKIIREARAKRGKLQYRGTPIAIYEDYPSEIVEQRREYQEVMSELYQRGFKPALLFPARLNITLKDGARKRLSSVSEAKNFIAANRSGIGSHASSSA